MLPLCKHFGVCGGCKEQAILYEQQLEQKEKKIHSLFAPFQIFPIISCKNPWAYRNKMEFSFADNLKGDRFLGLLRRDRRQKVLDIEECYLAPTWFTDVLKSVRKWWEASGHSAFFAPKGSGFLRTLTLREGLRTKEKMVILTVNPQENFDEENFVDHLLCDHRLDSVILREQVTRKKQPTRFFEKTLFGNDHIREELFHERRGQCLLFKIRPSSFFQPNTLQAETIYNRVIELADLREGDSILDLYCGTGAIGLFASFLVKRAEGVEINGEAVLDARENGRMNGVRNWNVVEGDVGSVLSCEYRPDVVFVDPPRVGLLGLTIQKLLTLGPKKIVYVSCNPESQVSDVQCFMNNGYEIECVQPVDQFPHTPHLENIVVLKKTGSPKHVMLF